MVAISDKRRENRALGFTLIELLVVVAIITLLIAILVPSLGKAKQAAKSAACKSNLHQFAVGFQTYLAANGGMGRPGITFSDNFTYTTWFYTETMNPSNPAKPNYLLGGWIGPMTLKAIICPAFEGPKLPGQYDIPQSSYSPNGATPWMINTLPVESSSETMMWTDAASVNSLTGAMDWPTYSMAAPSSNIPAFHGRHSGLGNVAWYDGHVSSELPFIQTLGLPSIPPLMSANNVKKLALGHLTPVPPSASQTQFLTNPRRDYYFWMNKTSQQ